MRRAISWVYCAPKSRMRILSLWMSVIGFSWQWTVRRVAERPAPASTDLVVRRLLGDGHVVHVALALAGAGDHHELRLAAHLLDGAAADVAHGGAQAAGELVDDAADRAAVRDAALDAFRHQLVGVGGVLEVAVLGALLHRAQRAHAAVALVAAALEQLDLARGLLGAGEQAADHHRGGTGGDRLADVAGVADAAVGDQRDAVLQRLGHQVDGGDLRHAHARDHARGADRARAHADLDRVGAGVEQGQRGVAGDDVAADHLHLREVLLDPGHAVQHALGMAVRGVHDQHVHAGGHQRLDALLGVAAHAHRGADHQPAVRVLGGVGVVGLLLDVLDRDHAAQLEVVVDDQHLLDAVLVQQLEDLVVAGAFLDRDQAVLLGHDVAHRIVELLLEAHVAAGDDAGQLAVSVHHRHAGDVARAGQLQHLADGRVGTDGERVLDHAGLELLDLGDLVGLLLDGQVLVDDADAPELGHGDRQARFGHRVHRRRDDRQLHPQVAGQARLERNVLRQYG